MSGNGLPQVAISIAAGLVSNCCHCDSGYASTCCHCFKKIIGRGISPQVAAASAAELVAKAVAVTAGFCERETCSVQKKK
jgi:hypothetical protein